jgi:hypothetical protein
MKKVVTLVLAIALVLTSVVALADGTPNINSFATMKVKYHELKSEPWGAPAYWEITLSKPVDRLLINWSGKGEEPEELAVDENLKATALKGSHKYMPGTSQYYATWVSVNNRVVKDEVVLGYDVEASETVYAGWSKTYGKDLAFEYEEISPERELDPEAPISIEDQIASYKAAYPGDEEDYIVVKPVKYVDDFGDEQWTYGYIQLVEAWDGIDPKSIQTVVATPVQTAFMTVQGEWAVYYNRAGRIVGIEKFEGQF